MIVKETTKQCKDKRFQDWWKSMPGQREANKFPVGYRLTFTADLLSTDRNSVRTTMGLLTGYCMLRKYMSNLGLTEEPVYRFCQEWARNMQKPKPALGDYPKGR
ncbi:hypothetical protein Trydic_g18971 [Trypoxylus dichotomus]